jgi:excisionase family DNA binding protein
VRSQPSILFEIMHPEGTAFDLLTVAEVAKLLHCSKAHVCNAVAGKLRGCPQIPSVRMGRRMLVRRESLMVWLEQSEAASVSKPERKSA